jgi:hypothetical protein
MKKLAKVTFLYMPVFIVVLFIVCEFIAAKRVYLQSPDGSKTITLYKYNFFSNECYVTPYKYTGLFPPKDNYYTVTVMFTDLANYILINWHPLDGSYLKMSTYKYITNKLHDNIKISKNSDDAIDEIDLNDKEIKYSNAGMEAAGKVANRYPSKYTYYYMDEVYSNVATGIFALTTVFLIFIVEPVLCLILLLWAILKKIGYYWPLGDSM